MALTQVTSIGLKDGEIVNADLHSAAAIALSKLADTGALGSAITATTQSASDDTTKLATTAFVQAAVTSLIDGAPGSLNTLNELAAAINDDSSYATTLTTALATKLPLAGGTLTGALTVNSEINAKRLTLSDDGAASPILLIKTDDTSPWGFQIRNDTYGTSHEGLKIYQSNAGVNHIQTRGTSARGRLIMQQHNGTTTNNMIDFTEAGSVEIYHAGTKKLETHANGVHMSGSIYLPDSQIAGFGDVSNPDLRIYHDGANSYINDTSTGELYIQGDSFVAIRAYGSGENMGKFIKDGAVELYWGGTGAGKKLETTSVGVTVTGKLLFDSSNEQTIKLADNRHIHFGTSSDLKIYHDGSDSYISHDGAGHLIIQTDGSQESIKLKSKKHISLYVEDGTELALQANESGAVELYHANAKVFYTEAYGAVVKRPSGGSTVLEVYGSEGENAEINLKADDADDNADRWKLKANASSSLFEIQDYASSNWLSKIQVQGGSAGAVFLSYGNSQKFYTTSTGATVSGTITSEVTGTNMVAGVFTNSGSTSDGTEVQIRNDTNTPADGDQTGYLQFSGKDSNGNSTIYNAIIGYTDDVTDGTEDGSLKFFCRTNGGFAQRLLIAADGTFTGSASNDISDQRLKDNIATVVDPIGKIKALKGRTFTWKPEANLPEGTKYGFIAQEVEAVVSDLVDNKHGLRQFDKDNNLIPQDEKARINKDEGTTEAKAVHATGVVPILVEALKEALTKIETLETKVAALEGG